MWPTYWGSVVFTELRNVFYFILFNTTRPLPYEIRDLLRWGSNPVVSLKQLVCTEKQPETWSSETTTNIQEVWVWDEGRNLYLEALELHTPVRYGKIDLLVLSALFVAFSVTNSDENTINNRDLCLCWIILTVFLLCLLFTVVAQGSVCLWKEELFNRSQRAFSPRLVYITNTEMTFRFVCLF